jgi:hypothetical protein
MQFSFRGRLEKSPGDGAWYFITLPKDKSAEIKFFNAPLRVGFGSVRVKAKIGDTDWRTSIFPSKPVEAYLLPVKAEIRKKNKLGDGEMVDVHISLSLD